MYHTLTLIRFGIRLCILYDYLLKHARSVGVCTASTPTVVLLLFKSRRCEAGLGAFCYLVFGGLGFRVQGLGGRCLRGVG